jgi:arylformamidase
LMGTAMNETLHLDAAECAAESPAHLALRADVAAHVWVGGQERPAFLWQARLLSEHWACPWTVDPGRHHFDVVDGLTDPASALMAACLDGL